VTSLQKSSISIFLMILYLYKDDIMTTRRNVAIRVNLNSAMYMLISANNPVKALAEALANAVAQGTPWLVLQVSLTRQL